MSEWFISREYDNEELVERLDEFGYSVALTASDPVEAETGFEALERGAAREGQSGWYWTTPPEAPGISGWVEVELVGKDGFGRPAYRGHYRPDLDPCGRPGPVAAA